MTNWITKDHVRNICKLYKTILKLHRALPTEAKLIGDSYVKEEFKRHKNISQHESLIFAQEWTEYAVILIKQLSGAGIAKQNFGKDLAPNELDLFREEQVVQLYELLQASKELGQGKSEK